MKLNLRGYQLDLGRRTCIMGILNITPDSFWDGGKYASTKQAIARAREMIAQGADVIDVGGESTRPGGAPVDQGEEASRIRDIVSELVATTRIPISIDTRKASVARAMLGLGAHMINDTSGLAFDPEMAEVASEFDVPVVIMHMRGVPETMQTYTIYGDVVADVRKELAARVAFALSKGIRSENIVLDPGIGFAKTGDQNVELIARLDELGDLGKPILVGPSMKSFIGKTLGLGPGDRGEATIAACIMAAARGANIVRVHDVAGVAKALAMFDYIKKFGVPEAHRVD
ncbi:MAG TPA: dihydropteroate synthase [bacterium]|nr:dihydropteroate synthase [bacterium]